jgi:hypothetical protein
VTSEQKSGPKSGEVWRRAKFYQMSCGHPQETRHVVDRTLGGDVIFVKGRWSRNAYREQCTLTDWREWCAGGFGAKKL